MESNFEVANVKFEREFKVKASDRNLYWNEQEVPAVELTLLTRNLVRVELDGIWKSTAVPLDGTEVSFKATAEEIDELIVKLQLAKSLIGQDFLIFDHVDHYLSEGVTYTFDGKEVERD